MRGYEKIFIALILVLVAVSSVEAFTFYDDFNRATIGTNYTCLVVGGCVTITNNQMVVSTGGYALLNVTTWSDFNVTFTINATGNDGFQFVFSWIAQNNHGLFLDDGARQLYWNDGTYRLLTSPAGASGGNANVRVQKSGNNFTIFVNGTLVSSWVNGNFSKVGMIGFRGDNKVWYIDNLNITDGNETAPPPPSIPSPSWVNPTPGDGWTNNTQATLNASCTAPFGYNLYIQNTSGVFQVLKNSSTSHYTTNYSNTISISYWASCVNLTTGATGLNTSARNWTYDPVFPAITLNGNNEFKVGGYSRANQYDNNLFINLTFTDDNQLYAYEINISKGGIVYYNETNQSLTGTSFTYVKNLSIASWPVGNYTIQIYISDSHTKEAIKDYGIIKNKSKLVFYTESENLISIESEEESTTNTEKGIDRYNFNFNFKDGKSKDRTFHVKTDKCTLKYVENSAYKAHLVSYCPGSGEGNWIDFEGYSGTPLVNKINDHHFTVYFSNLPKNVIFNSIGGLNILNANFSWYRGNFSYNNDYAITNESSVLWVNVSKEASISNVSAILTYNGAVVNNQTIITTVLNKYFSEGFTAPGSMAVFPFIWNVTIYQGDGTNYTFTISSTQTVYAFGIDNCTISNSTTLIIYYYNEQDPNQRLNASLEVDLVAWISDRSNSINYSTTFARAANHTLCIFPNVTTLYSDVYLKYTAENGFTERYFFIDHVFDSTPETLNLYNWNDTTLTSILKLTVRQQLNYNYYPGVVATLQRLYVGSGTWRNVQMDESGDFGLLNFNILERTTDYRLQFLDRNTNRIIKTTDSLKFLCTSGLCDLTYLLNPDDSLNLNPDADINLSWNENTKIANLTWADTTGATRTVTFWLYKTTLTGFTTICQVNQTGNAGTYLCNASQYTGSGFISIKQDGELIFGENIDLSGDRLSDHISVEEGAFWTFVIVAITILAGVFSPVGSILTGIIGLVIVFWLGIWNVFTITGLIIAMIIGIIISLKVRT